MAPRRRCPTCGSRQWHKEPHSGLIACEEGHVLQNYRNEVNDAEEFGPHSLKKRSLKSNKTKKGRGSQANPELYHGARARYHYFECLQLLLRKQIAALTELWKLPPEFEVVCKDLWAMNLELLPNSLPSDVHLLGRDSRPESTNTSAPLSQKAGDSSKTFQTGKSRENSSSSSSDADAKPDNEDEGEGDSEMEALLRENSETEDSSGDDVQNPETLGSHIRHRGVKKTRGHELFEGPASLIAILIIGCWTIKIPVLCRDFGLLIEGHTLPYLDPVARGLLPSNMVMHLNKHTVSSLSPHHAPRTQIVHGIASRLCKHMHRSYGIFIPEVNAAPILWRVISDALCGTPMVYRLTKRVGQILSLPLTLHFTFAPGLDKLKNYDPDHHIYDNVPPEVAFLGAAIVVLKMIYGLDGRPRIPKDDVDAACSLPRAEDFLQSWEHETHSTSRDGIFDSRQNNVCMGDLTDQEIDKYLAFSERALISKQSGDGLLERYFPLRAVASTGLEAPVDNDRSMARSLLTDVKAVVSSTTSSSSLRPGEGYRIYRSRDVDGTLPETLQKIIERAAQWVGVEEEYLGGVIETYERRILQYQTRRKQ